MEKMYSISEKDLAYLVRSTEKWNAMEFGGVDNWTGYDYALENYFDDDNIALEELAEETDKEVIDRYFKRVKVTLLDFTK